MMMTALTRIKTHKTARFARMSEQLGLPNV